ncbi:MAG: Na+/H+ antiporter subunit G [Sedimentisphaerales bacterium]|nr:Na+/H+ antiporter subunit G [Sedimentisphaerales bacterium]
MNEVIGIILISIGLVFDLVGAIGLIRLPDIYNRLQAATKCVTLGTVSLLVGAGVYTGLSHLGMKALLCAWFILLTSPVGAHAIARGAHLFGVKLWEGSLSDAYKEYRKTGSNR